jgi:hypothetical protein
MVAGPCIMFRYDLGAFGVVRYGVGVIRHDSSCCLGSLNVMMLGPFVMHGSL